MKYDIIALAILYLGPKFKLDLDFVIGLDAY